jgi:hypothetical protein
MMERDAALASGGPAAMDIIELVQSRAANVR